MVYELGFPEEIEDKLLAVAAAYGVDVIQVIQLAVVRFVRSEVCCQEQDHWVSDPRFARAAISAPVELPLLGRRLPVSVTIHPESRLRPDPIECDDDSEGRRHIL